METLSLGDQKINSGNAIGNTNSNDNNLSETGVRPIVVDVNGYNDKEMVLEQAYTKRDSSLVLEM